MFVGFFTWETYFRDNLMYEQVIALKNTKEKGEIITADDIHQINVEINSFKDALKNSEGIVGMVTLVDIPSNIPLSETYFDNPDITPLKDQFVFEIPNEWIYGVPQSLRAKDKIFFYEVKPNQTVENTLIIENNDVQAINDIGDYEFVLSSVAKYVKDGSNREVTNVGETRNDGSSKVSSIEVIGTLDELVELETKVKNGSKFIILYNEG